MHPVLVNLTIPAFLAARNEYGNKVTVGFVPTMGALHAGKKKGVRIHGRESL